MDEKNYISNKEDVKFEMGSEIADMQVGCLWMGEHLISVSLSGNINYLDIDNPSTPKRVIKGHNKSIVTSCLNDDRNLLFTSSFDGVTCCWDLATGLAEQISGERHQNEVTGMQCSGDTVITCGMDDTVRFISVKDKKFTDVVVKLDSQPKSCSIGKLGFAAVACVGGIYVIQDGQVTHRYKAPEGDSPTAISVSSSLGKVVVGFEDRKVKVYSIEGDQLMESSDFPTNNTVTDIKFSPDDQFVALCTASKQVKVVRTDDFKTELGNWSSHSVKVNAIGWSPDSLHLASSGTDGSVIIWSMNEKQKKYSIRGAHSQSVDVTSVQWTDNKTLLTCGRQDCSVRTWDIKI